MKKIRYTCKAAGLVDDAIYIEVPWGNHSGMIPPPTITFFYDGAEVVFAYDPK